MTSLIKLPWLHKLNAFQRQVPALSLPVLFAGVALRAAGLGNSAIWYDESYSLYLMRLPLLQMVRTSGLDFSPPLWEIIAYPFVRLLGQTEIALRLPSLLSSVAGLWLAWKLLERFNVSPVQKFCASALCALLPYQFWMSQDGRVYALYSTLYLAATYFATKRRWLGLSASGGLLLYAHNTGPFYLATALGLGLLLSGRRDWMRLLTSAGASGLSFAPWLPAYLQSAHKYHWLGSLSTGILNTGLFRIFFAGSLSDNLWIFLGLVTVSVSIIIAAIVSLTHIRKNKSLALLGLIAVGPLVLMVAGAAVKNVIFYRPLSPLALPLGLWLGSALPQVSNRFLKWLLGYNWLLLVVIGLLSWSTVAKGGELRDLAGNIQTGWSDGDVIYHATATSLLPLSVYLPHHPHILLDEEQHNALLSRDLQDAFGVRRAALESVPHKRAWIVWARDAFMSDAARRRMEAYTQGGILVGEVHYWQASTIQLWLVNDEHNQN